MKKITDNQIKQDLCFSSSGYLLNRNIASTGFCIDSSFLHNDIVDEQAELFLLNSNIDTENSETVYSINKYLKYPFTEMTALSGSIVYSGLEKVKLEKNYQLEMSLEDSITRRKSSRKYSGDSIPSNYISTILRKSSGITHGLNDGNFLRQQRVCASGGGLYPVKLYLFANKVKKLERAIYIYDPLQDSLFVIEKNSEKLDAFLTSETINEVPNIKECAFIVFFAIESWKSLSKYGSAGLKFAYMEIGEIAQNAHLIATCLGIGSCAYASFTPDAVNHLLKIDGDYESFQHAILFGVNSEG